MIPAPTPEVVANVRRTRDQAAAVAAYHRSLVARLNPNPIPLVTEQVMPIGQSYEARLAREHLTRMRS